MRGLKRLASIRTMAAGHAFVQNLRGLSSGSLCVGWTSDSDLDQLHRPGGERRGLV